MKKNQRLVPWLFPLCLGLYLALWAGLFLSNSAWSSWNAADVQTLNTLRYWHRDGAAHHAGLFLVQGYSPFIQAIESPELNHHGLASVRSENGMLVQSVYYNHYPSGFLIPEYLLALLIGVPGPAPFQLLQFFFSAGALVGLYLFLKEVFPRRGFAELGTSIYALSHLFLGYGYTLTNQPLDDLARFLILWLIVKDRGAETRSTKRLFAIAFLYILLSLSTLDSLIFVFAFMVLYDVLITKRWRWLDWSVGAGIAVGGRLVQFAQSAAAFGSNGALGDILHSFSQRAQEGGSSGILVPIKQRLYAITLEWTQILGTTVPSGTGRFLIGAAVILFICLIIYLARREQCSIQKPAVVAGILGIAGAGFPLLVPVAGYMPYQGRQWLPAGIAASLWVLWIAYRNREKAEARIPRIGAASLALAFIVCVTATGVRSFKNGGALQVFPTTGFSEEERLLGKALNAYSHNPGTDIIFFYKPEDRETEVLLREKTFGYQTSPYLSYISDRLLLESTSIPAIMRDIDSFEEKTGNAVTPIVLTHTEKEARELFFAYAEKQCPETQETPKIIPLESWFATRLMCEKQTGE